MKANFAFLLSICASTAIATTAANEFGAHQWPTEPKLSINVQPDLCKQILDDALRSFTSADTDIDIAAGIASDFKSLTPTPLVSESESDTISPLSRLDLDLDGTGNTQVIINRNNTFNWRGDWHYSYVFKSAADFESAKSQLTTAWLSVPDSQYTSPSKQEFSAQQYYPSALTTKDEEIQTGNVWAEHSLFEANKRFYFVAGTTTFDRQKLPPVEIFRLLANGHIEAVCKIESSNVDEAYKAFTKLTAVGSLLTTIRTMGAGGNNCGTLQCGAIHDGQANAAEIRAAYRPWATSAATQPSYQGDNPYYRFDERTIAFLEGWSFQELWNRREYQTLRELIAPAEASYAIYLQNTFGLSADSSRLASVKVIQALIGSRFEVPNQFTAAETKVYFQSTPLHDAVMRRDHAAFDAELADSKSTGQQTGEHTSNTASDVLSDVVRDAVEWPYGLEKLLSAGADPKQSNEFGKTPLMVAAHFDRPDSVRALIKAGAQVNATTHPVTSWSADAPQISGRTALMYAAENASAATIKVLLDAGADTQAKDSKGNDVAFYLNKNPRFTPAERALGVIGLAKIADQFSGPSYSCSKAHTPTEQAICGSDVLRIFDAQIARAFSTLKTKDGPAVVEEQRRWLQLRDQSCTADSDCLAEKMRTHLRSFLERIDE